MNSEGVKKWINLKKTVQFTAVFAFVAIFVFVALDAAQSKSTPKFMGYEGQLTDSNDNRQDGNFDMTFRIYGAKSGGNQLWKETHTGVSVADGYFAVTLGTNTPIDLEFDQRYWISLEVDNDGEMSPRQPINTVGYSFASDITYGTYATSSAPTPTSSGKLYFNTSTNKLFVDDGSQWSELADLSDGQTFTGTTTFTASTTLNTTTINQQLDVDSSTLFVDSANDRVGVNSSSPIADLSVEGQGFFTATTTASDLVASNSITINGDTRTAWPSGQSSIWNTSTGRIFTQDTSKTFLIGSQTTSTNNSTFEVNGSSYFSDNLRVGTSTEQITTSTFSLDGDDAYIHDLLGVGDELFVENQVNIGTSSLHLRGDTSGGEVRMDNGPLIMDATGNLKLNTTNNQNIITGSGNFGINESSPSKALHVGAGGSIQVDLLGYDISSPSFVDALDVESQAPIPLDIDFNSDGSKLYVLGRYASSIFEYNLSSNYDVSTAALVDNFDVSSQDNDPSGIAFNSDGSKLYVAGYGNGGDVYEYNLTTPYDVSTANGNFVDSFDVSSQDNDPSGIAFNSDGSKFYLLGDENANIYEYNLTTPYDVSTGSGNLVDTLDVSNEDISPTGMVFNSDGSKLYMSGASYTIHEYSLSSPYDVSTGSGNVTDSFSPPEHDKPVSVNFNNVGSKLYVLGGSDAYNQYEDNILEYDLSTSGGNLSIGGNADISGAVTTTDLVAQSSITLSGDKRTSWSDVVGTYGGWTTSTGKIYSSNTSSAVLVGTDTTSTNNSILEVIGSGYISNKIGIGTTSPSAALHIGRGNSAKIDGEGYDISRSRFEHSTSTQDTCNTGVTFNDDGTKMYEIQGELCTSAIYEYDLSDPFDVSTASYLQSFNLSDGSSQDVVFNNDGTKMFEVGRDGDNIYEYNLSPAYDVSSASQIDSINTQGSNPRGLDFNNDGSKMYEVDGGTNLVYEYNLNNFDISTANFSQSKDISANTTAAQGIRFNNIGTKMFIVDDADDQVHQFNLSTAFDISTANFSQSRDIKDNDAQGLEFSNTGFDMYIAGSSAAVINQHSITPIGGNITMDGSADILGTATTSDLVAQDSITLGGDKRTSWSDLVGSYSGWTTSSGKIYPKITSNTVMIGADSSITSDIFQVIGDGYVSSNFSAGGNVGIGTSNPSDALDLNGGNIKTTPVGWDVGTAVYNSVNTSTDSVLSDDARSFSFKDDGTKMYVLDGDGSDKVHQFTLDTPWDVSSASYDSVTLDVTSEEDFPRSLAFGDSGSKMYVVGESSDTVYQYDLSTAWDLSTASYNSNKDFDVSSQDGEPNEVVFGSNGSKMYIAGESNNDVYQYNLSTSWDPSSASYSSKVNVNGETGPPYGLFFRDNGKKMYTAGPNKNRVSQYNLSTAWDLGSTVTYEKNKDIVSEEWGIEDVAFKSNGGKMFIIGSYGNGSGIGSNTVNQYKLSTSEGNLNLGGNADISGTATTSDLIAQNSITLNGDKRTSWSDIVNSFGGWTTSTGKIYPSNTSSAVLVGTDTTSTNSSILEVSGDGYVSGKLGIGTSSPSSALEVDGNITADFASAGTSNNLCYSSTDSGTIGTCSSLSKYKDGVTQLGMGLDTIMQLKPKEFTWNTTGRDSIGFVAEDVEKVDSRLSTYDENSNLIGVRYDQMTALLTKALQERNKILNTDGAPTSSPALVVNSTGDIGIGTSTPKSKLTVNGKINASNLRGGPTSLSVDNKGNVIRTPSDQKLKENIKPISGALQKVIGLQGVSYNWKDENRFGYEEEIGFVAQDVGKIVPQAVQKGGRYMSLNYGNLTAMLVEAVKEQQKQIQGLAAGNNIQGSSSNLSTDKLTVASSTEFGKITVKDHATFGEDTVGQAVVKKGYNKVTVNFKDKYKQQPIVTANQIGEPVDGLNYSVKDVSTAKFKIMTDDRYDRDIKFSWHAFAAGEDSKISFSDGTTSTIEVNVEEIKGCTNPDAENYDPDATANDGSCKIGGCIDVLAENYDPDATYGDGSCSYSESSDSSSEYTSSTSTQDTSTTTESTTTTTETSTTTESVSSTTDTSTTTDSTSTQTDTNSTTTKTNTSTTETATTTKTTDEIAPEITMNGSTPVTLYVGDSYDDVGATAEDNKGGDLTDKIKTTNNVDTSIPGTYEVLYSVADAAGNTAEKKRTVEVKKRESSTSSTENVAESSNTDQTTTTTDKTSTSTAN